MTAGSNCSAGRGVRVRFEDGQRRDSEREGRTGLGSDVAEQAVHVGELLLLGPPRHVELVLLVLGLVLDGTLELALDLVDLLLEDGPRHVEHLERRLEVVLAVRSRRTILALVLPLTVSLAALGLGLALAVVLAVAAKVKLGVRGPGGGVRGRRARGGRAGGGSG